jgi:hypothetical protein
MHAPATGRVEGQPFGLAFFLFDKLLFFNSHRESAILVVDAARLRWLAPAA